MSLDLATGLVPRGARAASTMARASVATLRASIRHHRVYLFLILGYGLAMIVAGALSGGSAVINLQIFSEPLLVLTAVPAIVTVLGHAIWVMVVVRPEGALAPAIVSDFRDRFLTARRLADFLVVAGTGPLFFSIFGSFKQMVPYLNPFSWDATLMSWDRALHGGQHAWLLLQPWLATPWLTSAINVVYNIWIIILFGIFLWQAWSTRRPALRMQFLLSFVLCWIVVGTVLATVFSSAGPVFYGRVTGLDDPYAPLMRYLYTARESFPVWSLAVQEMLWNAYANRHMVVGGGISAMPSMHVAIAVLFALLGWRIGRRAGIALTLFALIIQIGSVHLGWHYAIDGYVAAVTTMAIWFAVGRALRGSRRGTRPAPRNRPPRRGSRNASAASLERGNAS